MLHIQPFLVSYIKTPFNYWGVLCVKHPASQHSTSRAHSTFLFGSQSESALLLLWLQKYLSSLVNLSFRSPILLSRILAGMMVEVVRTLPVPRTRKIRPTIDTCQVASSLKEQDRVFVLRNGFGSKAASTQASSQNGTHDRNVSIVLWMPTRSTLHFAFIHSIEHEA